MADPVPSLSRPDSPPHIADMSRAFVKDTDADAVEDLPDRPVSEHPNESPRKASRRSRRRSLRRKRRLAPRRRWAIAPRWRRLPRPALLERAARHGTRRAGRGGYHADQVGTTVTILRDDGREQTFRIVGEDEADPRTERCRMPRRWRARCSGKRSAMSCRPAAAKPRSWRSAALRRNPSSGNACKARNLEMPMQYHLFRIHLRVRRDERAE